MRADTVIPARSSALAVTESPSTSRTGVNVTASLSPSAETRSMARRSPSLTLYCFPPVFMTAYTSGASYRTVQVLGTWVAVQRPLACQKPSEQLLVQHDAAAVARRAGLRERLDQTLRDPL